MLIRSLDNVRLATRQGWSSFRGRRQALKAVVKIISAGGSKQFCNACNHPPFHDGGPIAILRMDGDFYEFLMDTLNNLYEKVVPGGIIIIDDYYYWQGARKAVHDFLSQRKLVDTIHQHRDGYPYLLEH